MANTDLVLFGGRTEYPATVGNSEETPGEDQGVHIVTEASTMKGIYEMLARWFAPREDVMIVDYGTSDKQHLGFIKLEWCEGEPDQLFIDILNAEEAVLDYTLYSREVQ